MLCDEVGVVGPAVLPGKDVTGGGVRDINGQGVGDLATAVDGEQGRSAWIQGDPPVPASGLRLALDDPVADIDMLADDREAPGCQVNLGPA